MRGIKEKIAENLSYINPVSRRMLLAGRGFDYWRCIYLAKDALDCIRPSMGVMLFGSLIMQAIDPKGENQD